jgi:hypothetical protein
MNYIKKNKMSYSRFGNSTWYTFWAADSADCRFKWPTEKLKNNQVFQICDFPSFTFTYGKLQKAGMSAILAKVEKFYTKEHKGQIFKEWKGSEMVYEDTVYEAKNPTQLELDELLLYIREWEKDINKHFKFWTFMRYEWYYPIKTKMLWKLDGLKEKIKYLIGHGAR